MIKIIIDDASKGERLDKVLTENTEFSRSKIKKMIDNEHILVNDEKTKGNYKTKENDVIEITEEKEELLLEGENIPLEILYEDDYLLVVNKKSGMVVHPAPGHKSGTMVNALIYHTKLSNNDIRPGIVHRIDKDTSGLLMVAKTDEVHTKLAEELKEKKTTRKYIALVEGVINNSTGTIDAPIGRDANNRKKMDVTSTNSKEAITHFKVLERYKDKTLIECILETGRTHQIRVHMKYIKHPIVNDPLYNNKKSDSYGQMLHAKTLGFTHPITGEYMEFDSIMPEEFEKRIKEYKESLQ